MSPKFCFTLIVHFSLSLWGVGVTALDINRRSIFPMVTQCFREGCQNWQKDDKDGFDRASYPHTPEVLSHDTPGYGPMLEQRDQKQDRLAKKNCTKKAVVKCSPEDRWCSRAANYRLGTSIEDTTIFLLVTSLPHLWHGHVLDRDVHIVSTNMCTVGLRWYQ